MTHRQFVEWGEWLRQQWNVPSRADHYVMQLNEDLLRVNSKQPRSVKDGCRKLKFKFEQAGGQLTEEQMKVQKQLFLARGLAKAGKTKATVVEVKREDVQPFDFTPEGESQA